MHIFQVVDKNRRKIHLSKERWKHNFWMFLITIQNPTKIKIHQNKVHYHFKYMKGHTPPFLLAIVKYLNNHGFIITAYLMAKI